jgi:hypothetical protein
MATVLGGLFCAFVGLLLLLNVGGVGRLFAELGRGQRERSGAWATLGRPQSVGAVRFVGLFFIVVGVGIAVFPPS